MVSLVHDTTISLHNVIGILGSFLIVVTYLLLQLKKMQVGEVRCSILNAMGAAGILYSLTVEFNFSAFLIESFWLAISLFGILQSLKDSRLRKGQDVVSGNS